MATIEFIVSGQIQKVELQASSAGQVCGRSPDNPIVLPSGSVSRKHGKFYFQAGQYFFEDLGSVNGSFLNEKRISGAVPINDGDAVRCGEVTMLFSAGEGSAPRPAPGPRATGSTPVPPRPEPASRPVSSPVVPVQPARPEPPVRPTAASEARPRPEPAPAPHRTSSASDSGASRKDLEDAKAAVAAKEEDIRNLQGLLTDSERRLKDAESRATMANSSLESIHAKYMDMREQVSHLQGLLDRTRGEGSDREAEAAELRDKVASLTAQIDQIRGKTGQNTSEIANLKVKLTEKDREVERLKKDLDSKEYDLKVLLEEKEQLEQYCNTDTGRQRDLERKQRNLEAIIEENRNLIAELRRGLEERDRELREVRLGVGIADLEHEKQKLLDDYLKKTRENDQFRSTVATLNADLAGAAEERQSLEARVRQLEEAARARKAEREDISDHPDFKAKLRELEGHQQTIEAMSRELDEMKHDRSTFSADEGRKISSELAGAQERVRRLTARVEELQAELAKRGSESQAGGAAAPAGGGGIPEDLKAFLAAIDLSMESLRDSMTVFQSGAKDVLKFLAAAKKCDAATPCKAAVAIGADDVAETLESLKNMQGILNDEVGALDKAWKAGEATWKGNA